MKGITLIELVIVMMLLLVLSIIAGVKVISFDEIKLSSAASKLASDISYCQQLAITTQIPHGLSFDVTNNQYFLFETSPATKIKDPFNRAQDFIVDYDNIDELSNIVINSVNINSTHELWFDGLGIPYDANQNPLSSNGTIVLKIKGNSKAITIIPQTGKVNW
ncbi:MAG: hypothetical protein NC920_02710 [Candidatus Omnitrophica bacterium]|nr:hypothetical protein [Candidatus Omnitrophota bacterium]